MKVLLKKTIPKMLLKRWQLYRETRFIKGYINKNGLDEKLAFGINIFGYLNSTSGLGQSARLVELTINNSHIPCSSNGSSQKSGQKEFNTVN